MYSGRVVSSSSNDVIPHTIAAAASFRFQYSSMTMAQMDMKAEKPGIPLARWNSKPIEARYKKKASPTTPAYRQYLR